MIRDAHIVAVGARTPVGLTAESSVAAVRAGISRVREHPFMIDAAGEKLKCAYDGRLASVKLGPERLLMLARHALHEVAAKLTAQRPYASELLVLLTLPEPRPGFAPDHARWLQLKLQAEPLPGIARVAVERSGEGHAGGLRALDLAVQRVTQAQHELCIVLGVDSYLDADTLDWLEADLRLARSEIRSGFAPGEGASAVAVASNAVRSALGLRSLARIRSVACANEKRSPKSDEGLLGEALTDVIVRVGETLHSPGELFQNVYCDINGERDRTDDWGFALLRTSQLFRDGTAYTMSVSQCGDLGAATVGLNCAMAVQAWQRGYGHGPVALVWGASWSGLRGAAVLEQSRG